MFNNIGRKIKTLAKVICWIGIIISVVAGVVMVVGSTSSYDSTVGIVGGILTAVLGSLFSWLGSFMMVGFGELVEKTAEIAANTRGYNHNNY